MFLSYFQTHNANLTMEEERKGDSETVKMRKMNIVVVKVILPAPCF